MSPRRQCHDLAPSACEGSKRAYLQKINYLNRELSVNQTPDAKLNLEALIVIMQGAKGIRTEQIGKGDPSLDHNAAVKLCAIFIHKSPKCHEFWAIL
jgi:hypothetical protein